MEDPVKSSAAWAPYLHDPLVLVGFVVMLFAAVAFRYVGKSGGKIALAGLFVLGLTSICVATLGKSDVAASTHKGGSDVPATPSAIAPSSDGGTATAESDRLLPAKEPRDATRLPAPNIVQESGDDGTNIIGNENSVHKSTRRRPRRGMPNNNGGVPSPSGTPAPANAAGEKQHKSAAAPKSPSGNIQQKSGNHGANIIGSGNSVDD
jgi:hypothetical protein